jgi:diguanylate cyclase (GGDEF)-like protein
MSSQTQIPDGKESEESDAAMSVRLGAATRRNAKASGRDLLAWTRDEAAEERDRVMVRREALSSAGLSRAVTGAEVLSEAAEQRKRAAEDRAYATQYRVLAVEDRVAAATDRTQGARDRAQAVADLEAVTRQLALTETDYLTGTRTRRAGLLDLEHEVQRCHRESGQLALVYIDVVNLKAVNDSEGHGAGDRMLRHVVAHIRVDLRSDDLLIRIGGDEFLCALPDLTETDARNRLRQIAGSLAGSSQPVVIRTGFAQLTGSDTVNDLITRADQELTGHRRHKRLADAQDL